MASVPGMGGQSYGNRLPGESVRSVTRYAYDASGLPVSVTVENGAADYATTFEYDRSGRRTKVSNPNFADISFTYTARGETRTRSDARGTTTWTYDRLCRTTSRSDPDAGRATWTWDPSGAKGLIGKRTHDDKSTTLVEFEESLDYDSDERPKTVTTTLRTSSTDARTFKETYTHDGTGRLSTVTHPSGLKEAFSYNAASGYELIVPDDAADHDWVDTTRLGSARLVRTTKAGSATPASVTEHTHADHLGSQTAATDASGAVPHSLAHDPYGARRKDDWSSQLPAEAIAEVADGQDEGRSRDGFTGHEPLDRTGFIHMGGRLYDPRLGRFLSPDPVVSEPVTGQGWNLYSYVGNSPMGRTDPSGYCYMAGPACPGSRATGGGFTSQAATLTTRGVSISYSHALSVSWSYVPGRYGSYGEYGYGGYYAPHVSLVAIPQLSIWARERTVSLGQETAPADEPLFTWRDAASVGVGFIPFVGTAQSVVEMVTGYDYVAGEAVDRRLAALGVLGSVVPGGKAAIKGIAKGAKRRPPGSPRAILEKPTAENRALQKAIHQMYRETDTVGGGTPGAVRLEHKTGEPVGGKFHDGKLRQRIRNLEDVMGTQRLSQEDVLLARDLRLDWFDALEAPLHPRHPNYPR